MHTFSTALRKSVARAAQANGNARNDLAAPSRCAREKVLDIAEEMFVRGDKRRISRVAARRLQMPEDAVERALGHGAIAYRRRHAAVVSNIKNVLTMDAATLRSIEDDFGSAA